MNQSNIAFVFPGQGSQSVGMLSDLAENHSIIQETFEQASSVLGRDLWALSQNGPADELNQTQNTQPAVLTASVALWRVWQGVSQATPAIMAGHSLGEYSALVCAGALNFEDAVALVENRATFMQDAVPKGEGAMAAILGLDIPSLVEICRSAANGEVVSPVNFNAPGQVVIAGQTTAVERAIELAKEGGAKRALPLPVSVPSHCALMEPAADRLQAVLDNIDLNTANIKVIHNTDVSSHSDASDIKLALKKQLYTPVRWTETIESCAEQGIDTVIECGPGKVLAGLNKRINKSMTALALTDAASFEKTLEALS